MITVALLQSTESISMAVLTIRAVIKYGLFTDYHQCHCLDLRSFFGIVIGPFSPTKLAKCEVQTNTQTNKQTKVQTSYSTQMNEFLLSNPNPIIGYAC